MTMCWRTLVNTFRGEAIPTPFLMQIGRFALVGAGRTILSFLLYLALMSVAPYWLAFTLSFAITITFSAFVNGRYVFLVALTPRSYLLYVGLYLLNYLVSLALLVLVVELLGVSKRLAPIPVIICIFPISFFSERYILRSNVRRSKPAP
jgi:putative flippase GtrA